MDLSFSEEQEMLRTMVHDFLTDRCPKKLVEQLENSDIGYSPEIWKEMAGLGWIGLAFPEKYGGAGMSFLDLAILLEEMGRACLPSPYFSTVILGGLPILNIGNEAQKQEYLPKIARGELIFTLALTEPAAKYSPESIAVNATANKDEYVLNGTKLFVPDAHIADYMLCVAGRGDGSRGEAGICIFIVDAKSAGVSCKVLETIASDKLCEVVFHQVEVPKKNLLGELNSGWGNVQNILGMATVAKCCEMLGGAQQVMEMTIDYAKNRRQFDRAIGSFQIIQHYCADMLIDVDAMRYSTYQAAWMISQGLPCTREVAIAKAWANEAYGRIIALAHQIHGAIGFTTDHDLHFYTKRAKAAQVTFGNTDFHRDIVAQMMAYHNQDS